MSDGPVKKSKSRPAGTLALLEETDVHAIQLCQDQQLNEVDTSLPALALRQERLRSPQLTCCLLLGQAGLPSRLAQTCEELSISWPVLSLVQHAETPPVESNALLSGRCLYPKMGYNRRCDSSSGYGQNEPGTDNGLVEMWLRVQPDVIGDHEEL